MLLLGVQQGRNVEPRITLGEGAPLPRKKREEKKLEQMQRNLLEKIKKKVGGAETVAHW